MSLDFHDVQEDLLPLYRGDAKLSYLNAKLRAEYKAKGFIYYELGWSKFYNHLKYLVTEYPDGRITITDLDTNEEIIV